MCCVCATFLRRSSSEKTQSDLTFASCGPARLTHQLKEPERTSVEWDAARRALAKRGAPPLSDSVGLPPFSTVYLSWCGRHGLFGPCGRVERLMHCSRMRCGRFAPGGRRQRWPRRRLSAPPGAAGSESPAQRSGVYRRRSDMTRNSSAASSRAVWPWAMHAEQPLWDRPKMASSWNTWCKRRKKEATSCKSASRLKLWWLQRHSNLWSKCVGTYTAYSILYEHHHWCMSRFYYTLAHSFPDPFIGSRPGVVCTRTVGLLIAFPPKAVEGGKNVICAA